ncbi:MAG: ACT domain-containing protein [Clostridia bacterium]|nr:ACT domain-containing protein [Clostridia bacterium]
MQAERAVATVLGIDRIGIIAAISTLLAERQVNILDIRMTTVQEFFTMIMILDLARSTVDLADLQAELRQRGESIGVQVTLQPEAIFQRMHRL